MYLHQINEILNIDLSMKHVSVFLKIKILSCKKYYSISHKCFKKHEDDN